jgi:hypothetical protein
MVFPDDWPGVFIRGDHALFYATALRELLSRFGPGDIIHHPALWQLAQTMGSCEVTDGNEPAETTHAVLAPEVTT